MIEVAFPGQLRPDVVRKVQSRGEDYHFTLESLLFWLCVYKTAEGIVLSIFEYI